MTRVLCKVVPLLCGIFVVLALGASGCGGHHDNGRPHHHKDDGGPPEVATPDDGGHPADCDTDADAGPPMDMVNGSCQEDKDCAEGNWCERGVCLRCLDNGRCTTPHCSRHDGCDPGDICFYPPGIPYVDGYRLGYCVGPICGYPRQNNEPYRCNWSPHCPFEWECYPEEGFCIPPENDDSKANTDGTTVECNDLPCTCDADCSPGRYCNINGTCVRGTNPDGGPSDGGSDDSGSVTVCDTTDDCPYPRECREVGGTNRCVIVVPGVPCDSNDDCCNTLVCTDGYCQPPPVTDGGAGGDVETPDAGQPTDGGPPADGGSPADHGGADGGTAPDASTGSDSGESSDAGADAGQPDTNQGDAPPASDGGNGCNLEVDPDCDCPLGETRQNGVCVEAPSCATVDYHGSHDGTCHGHYPEGGVAAHFGRQVGHWRHCRCPRVHGPVTP